MLHNPWTASCQLPLSMGFSRQEYWSGLPFPPPGDLSDPGFKLVSLVSCTGKQVLYHLVVSSVAQSCPTLCDPMDCSTPGFPVHHQLPELAQTHVHRVGDAIQPPHPLSLLLAPSIYPSVANDPSPQLEPGHLPWTPDWFFLNYLPQISLRYLKFKFLFLALNPAPPIVPSQPSGRSILPRCSGWKP